MVTPSESFPTKSRAYLYAQSVFHVQFNDVDFYVEDVDKAIERAVAAGAKVLIPVKNQFWGDRTGRIIDPSGHVWTISTRIEETSAAEREERWSDIVKS